MLFFKYPLEAFLISTGIVALAEIGDKTQLLAFMLAAKFRRPWPIIGGILVATLANHALAGALGAWITSVVGPHTMRRVLGVGFIAMAIWMFAVVAGTTLGMMVANVPAMLLGNRIAQHIPVRLVHGIAALIFALLGVMTLLGAGARFGF